MTIPRLIRLTEVMDVMGVKPTTIYGRMKDGLLTPPIKLTARTSVWPESEIAAVNRGIIAGKSDAELRQLVKDLVAARAHAQTPLDAMERAPPIDRAVAPRDRRRARDPDRESAAETSVVDGQSDDSKDAA